MKILDLKVFIACPSRIFTTLNSLGYDALYELVRANKVLNTLEVSYT